MPEFTLCEGPESHGAEMLPASFWSGEATDHNLLLKTGFDLEPIGRPLAWAKDAVFPRRDDAFHRFFW